MFCSFTLDKTTSGMSKHAIHIVGQSTALWLASRSALSGCGSSSLMIVGDIDFLSFFANALYAIGVSMSGSLLCEWR